MVADVPRVTETARWCQSLSATFVVPVIETSQPAVAPSVSRLNMGKPLPFIPMEYPLLVQDVPLALLFENIDTLTSDVLTQVSKERSAEFGSRLFAVATSLSIKPPAPQRRLSAVQTDCAAAS